MISFSVRSRAQLICLKKGKKVKNRLLFFTVAATVILLNVMTVPAWAQRAATIRGAGNVGCGQFLEDRRQDRYKQYYTEWIAGFLSGYNIYSNQVVLQKIPDEATIDAYLQKHCRENPLDSVVRAAVFLIRDLGGYSPPSLGK